MKNKKIILVSLFFYEKNDNIRISTVYSLLKERGLAVDLITTDFNHRRKMKQIQINDPEITYLNVPEYKSNISFGRLYSHFVFAIRLFFYLKKLTYRPSKVYCILPTVSSGIVCNFFCKRKGIPFIIDIIDLWPESLIILSKYRRILKVLALPWDYLNLITYRSADKIYTGSVEYADHVRKLIKKDNITPVYLGTDMDRFKQFSSSSSLKLIKPCDEIWICYAGLLGNSYDFEVILESFKKLFDDGFKNLKLFFIGDGEEHQLISEFTNRFDLPIIITGFLNYRDFLKHLSYCDIAINSFKEGTRVAYSYKFNDYISAGLPVLNNLIGETATLIDQYEIGMNFNYTDRTLYDQIHYLVNHPEDLIKLKNNVTFVATHILSKRIVYTEMINTIIEL